ncbi:hypothetical protein GCM10010317_103500 [Streptomyces mirabilis]|nr:hypothetical protein GCM10010317_103500 [Streptomyces mirabilis]
MCVTAISSQSAHRTFLPVTPPAPTPSGDDRNTQRFTNRPLRDMADVRLVLQFWLAGRRTPQLPEGEGCSLVTRTILNIAMLTKIGEALSPMGWSSIVPE